MKHLKPEHPQHYKVIDNMTYDTRELKQLIGGVTIRLLTDDGYSVSLGADGFYFVWKEGDDGVGLEVDKHPELVELIKEYVLKHGSY